MKLRAAGRGLWEECRFHVEPGTVASDGNGSSTCQYLDPSVKETEWKRDLGWAHRVKSWQGSRMRWKWGLKESSDHRDE